MSSWMLLQAVGSRPDLEPVSSLRLVSLCGFSVFLDPISSLIRHTRDVFSSSATWGHILLLIHLHTLIYLGKHFLEGCKNRHLSWDSAPRLLWCLLALGMWFQTNWQPWHSWDFLLDCHLVFFLLVFPPATLPGCIAEPFSGWGNSG